MKNKFVILLMPALLLLVFLPEARANEVGYFRGLGRAYARGLKNIVGAPLEIPATIRKYNEESGRPVLRQTAGFFDGAFEMVRREGSGIWDMGAGLIPGFQEGIPVKPETLF